MQRVLSTMLILSALLAGPAPTTPQAHAVVLATDWGQMPLTFVANQGQTDERVAFYVQGSDKTLYFTPQGVTFALTDLPPHPPSLEGQG